MHSVDHFLTEFCPFPEVLFFLADRHFYPFFFPAPLSGHLFPLLASPVLGVR